MLSAEAQLAQKNKQLEAEEGAESDSTHGTVNEMMCEVEEENLTILGDASFWDMPFLYHFRVDIIERLRILFSEKVWDFHCCGKGRWNSKRKCAATTRRVVLQDDAKL
ncbi:hypothetical protein BsWGS_23650 [Bradybaena similaris]